jgi:ERCC4 domain
VPAVPGRFTSAGGCINFVNDIPAPTSARPVFIVARNPDPQSKLPYLIRLPLAGGDVLLKARDSWPRTARVYCHRMDSWPEEAVIVEEIPVRSCVRRGAAVDLLLDRTRENRSQIVFTSLKGSREAIFGQSRKTVAMAKPGARIPRARASGHADLEILVDTREQYPYRFVHQQASTRRIALPAGDYGVTLNGRLIAAVERKALDNFVHSLVDGSIAFVLAELANLPHAAVVVEDRYSRIFKLDFVRPGWVPEILATLQVRYQSVPIIFCETRPLAEEWTFRFLGAALGQDEAVQVVPGGLEL